jgi:branched-chain amino acid transport system permease protein
MFELLASPPLAVTFESFTDIDFWTGVGIIAGIYTILALGLQLNVGFTGIQNFGQAAFMAIGAYAMVILVTDVGISFWLSLPISILITIAFGLVVGLPSLRLRADYFAIATIAAAEAIRLFALNARDLTGGAQGTFGFTDDWDSVSDTIQGWIVDIGWTDVPTLFPLFLVVWVVAIASMFVLSRVQATPWGRVLRAIREDEDADRGILSGAEPEVHRSR